MLGGLKGSLKLRLMAPLRPRARMLRQLQYRGADFVVFANEDVGWRLIVNRQYEPYELRCLEECISATDTCVDVGANIGIYSVFMARKAPQGRVIAFEPIALYRRVIALNACLNGIGNLDVRDAVLADAVGERKFSVSEDGAYSSMIPTARKAETDTMAVSSSTLDALVETEQCSVDVVKIDVEGAELLVLRGASTVLSGPSGRPKALLVELEAANQAVYGYRPEDVVEFMAGFGYKVFSVTARGPVEGYGRRGAAMSALFLAPVER